MMDQQFILLTASFLISKYQLAFRERLKEIKRKASLRCSSLRLKGLRCRGLRCNGLRMSTITNHRLGTLKSIVFKNKQVIIII